MPTIQESVVVDRPIEEVFAFVTDPDNQTLINSNMMEYNSTGVIEKGSRAHGASKVAGKRIDWSSEVTEFDPPHTFAIRSIEAPMGFTIDWTFEDMSSHSTLVRFHQEVQELGGFFGKLADTLVTAMYAHDVRSNLHKLKELMEHE